MDLISKFPEMSANGKATNHRDKTNGEGKFDVGQFQGLGLGLYFSPSVSGVMVPSAPIGTKILSAKSRDIAG